MLTQYIQAAMRQAKYEILSDDGSFYGEIPGFQGVWANAELSKIAVTNSPKFWKNGFFFILQIKRRFRLSTV